MMFKHAQVLYYLAILFCYLQFLFFLPFSFEDLVFDNINFKNVGGLKEKGGKNGNYKQV